ncbi:MAG: ATP-binding protein [Candidatus Binatia bacterium]
MKTIRLPKLLTVGWSNILLTQCDEALAYTGPVTFDLENVKWAAPFGLTVLSVTLAKCLEQGRKVFYSPPTEPGLRKYLNRIGFRYHFLRGGPVRHRQTSLELRCLRGVDPGCSEALVDLISSSFSLSEDARYEMRTHLNELMTNGFDHSESTVGCYVCAQWYPARGNLRISFADGGIGIRSSLNDSGKYGKIKSDDDAIRMAIKPGVTTRKKQLGGFGLDYMRRYVRRNHGTLTMLSGNTKINFYSNKIEHKPQPCSYSGAIVDIKISPRTATPKRERREPDDLF